MKRIFALLLALLLFSAFPTFALASDLEESEEGESAPEETPAIEIVLSSPELSEDPAETPEPEETSAVEETPEPEDTPAPETTPTAQPEETPAPEETPEPLVIVDQLIIDDKHLYENMDLTYEQGYVPVVKNGYAYLTLPLLGEIYDESIFAALPLQWDLVIPLAQGFVR